MSEAERALERGDFALARKLARGTSDERAIFERTGPDRLIVWLAGACVILFVLITWLGTR